jgi:hypothetical protein
MLAAEPQDVRRRKRDLRVTVGFLLAGLVLVGQLAAKLPATDTSIQYWADEYQRGAHGAPTILLTGEFKAGTSTLRLRLENVSRLPVQLYPYQLHWGNPNSIMFFAVTTRGALLRQHWPIADPGEEALITIGPGTSLTGDIDLTHTLDGFPEAQGVSDVVVVWQYRLLEVKSKAFLPIVTGAAVAKRRVRTQ